MTASPYVLLDDSLTPGGRSLLYTEPERIVAAYAPGRGRSRARRDRGGVRAGLHAAGFFAYELGYCLEPKLKRLLPGDGRVPLFWLGLFRAPRPLDDAGTRAWLETQGAGGKAAISGLELSWTREDYDDAFAKVQDYIAAGDVYQINLTLKYRFAFAGDPVALYAALRRKQRVAYGALIRTGELDVLSLSPELFFRREGKHITARPMKGTAPRGRTPREDARLKTWLAVDEKQRAENLMIVDLLRNDLGRVARIGSVEVTDLFTVETYRSVHQMTSGITAELQVRHGAQGHAPRAVPVRLGHRRAQGPRHGDHPRTRRRAARRLYRRHRPYRALGRRPVQRRDPHRGARGQGGEMGIGSGIVADSKAEVRIRRVPVEGAFPHQARSALRADRDAALRAGATAFTCSSGISPGCNPRPRISAIRSPAKPCLPRSTRKPPASRRRSRMVRLLLAEDGTITVTSTRDHAADQGYGVALR